MKDHLRPVGALLRRRRADARLTLAAVAAQTGISAATLCRAEAGKSLSLGHYSRLTRWLGCDPVSVAFPSDSLSLPDWLELAVHEDCRLSSDAAQALADAFRTLYRHLAN